MGGATLFIIISLLCVVILCIRQFHDKKRSHTFDNRIEIELNLDVRMNTNPSYNITKQNKKQEDQYDYVLQNKFFLQDDPQDTIKMVSNPSYGRVQGCSAYNGTGPENDATIQPNLSCNSISKETTKMSKDEDEDEDGYVETTTQSTQRTDYLEIIGSTTKEDRLTYNFSTDDMENAKIDPNLTYDVVSRGIKLKDTAS